MNTGRFANKPNAGPQGYVCSSQAGARICKALGPEFLPYMEIVMPPLLQSAQLKPDVNITDAGSDDDEDYDNDDDEVNIRLASAFTALAVANGDCVGHKRFQVHLLRGGPMTLRFRNRIPAVPRWRRSTWATAEFRSAQACWRRSQQRATCCAATPTS